MGQCHQKKKPPRHSDTMNLNFNDENKTWPKFEEPSVYFSFILLFWRTFYLSFFFFRFCFHLCFTISLFCGAGFLNGYLWFRVIFDLRKGQKYLKSTSICFLCGSCGFQMIQIFLFVFVLLSHCIWIYCMVLFWYLFCLFQVAKRTRRKKI